MKQSKLLLIVLLTLCSFGMNQSFAKTSSLLSVRPLPSIQLFKTISSVTFTAKGGKMPLGKFQLKNGDGKLTDVYAEMEWEFSDFYDDNYTYIEYCNHFIRFYSDPFYSNALALPGNLTLNYEHSYSSSNPSDWGVTPLTAAGVMGTYETALGEFETYYNTPFYTKWTVLNMRPGVGYNL